MRGDWTIQVRTDLDDFNIPGTLEYLEEISTNSLKNLIRKQCKEYALEKFLNMKKKHSKLDNLEYQEPKIQSYLELNNMNVEDSKILLRWRLRMTKFGANYGDSKKKCPLCETHLDSQEEFFKSCNVVQNQISNKFDYQEIFYKPSFELVQVIKQMTKLRENQ